MSQSPDGALLRGALPVTASSERLDRDAVRDVLPVAVSLVPFAAVIGVTISQARSLPIWVGMLAGPLIYGGSAQLAALTLTDTGAGLLTVLGTVLVINARLVMYGAAIEPRFRGQPTWFRWLAPHFLVDQTYTLANGRPELSGPAFRRYWGTVGLTLGGVWVGTMYLAVALGPAVPADSPLTFAATAVFVALLVPRLRQRAARRPAALAAVVALVASPLPHGLGLLVGALAGVLPAILLGGRERP
jgi:predicted branched-subunit amino acid permease